jgi:hypothetical protein
MFMHFSWGVCTLVCTPSRLSPPAVPREESARNRVRTHQDFQLLTSLLHYFHLSLLLYFPPVQSLRFHPGEK